LTTDEALDLIDQAGRLGVKHITLTGGEPFLRKDLCELVANARKLGITVGIITNGSILDKNTARRLVGDGLNQLHISVDGPEELHNDIRRVPGMFERVERNVGILRAAQQALNRPNPTITVGCTVSALNQGRLDEIVDVGVRWKTPLSFMPIFYSTREQDNATDEMIHGSADVKPEDWHLPPSIREVDVETLRAAVARARQRARELNAEVELELGTREDIRNWYYDPTYANNNKCFYPWHTTRINPYGEVYPCSIKVSMGNLREQPLRDIWNGEAYARFRLQLRRVGLFPNCAKCCALNRHDLICRLIPRPRLPRWFRRKRPAV
jgi:radical SAM protein with 4Fe4S-binding SPASM domain